MKKAFDVVAQTPLSLLVLLSLVFIIINESKRLRVKKKSGTKLSPLKTVAQLDKLLSVEGEVSLSPEIRAQIEKDTSNHDVDSSEWDDVDNFLNEAAWTGLDDHLTGTRTVIPGPPVHNDAVALNLVSTIFFYAPWDHACIEVEAEVRRVARLVRIKTLAARQSGCDDVSQVSFYCCNMDDAAAGTGSSSEETRRRETEEICKKLDVRILPTFVIVKNGLVIKKIDGWDYRQLVKTIKIASGLS